MSDEMGGPRDRDEDGHSLENRPASITTPPSDDRALDHERLVEVERELQEHQTHAQEMERLCSSYVNLYVAMHALSGARRRHEVLAALHEIVVNLVGSEELAIFEYRRGATSLSLASFNGISKDTFKDVSLASGIIARVARTGETYLPELADVSCRSEALPHEEALTACIPMHGEGRVTGVIAIFRLLSHKRVLGPLDHEIFDLLAARAGISLELATLFDRHSAERS